MISGGDNFTYIGYTHGGISQGHKPTLYFKEGRYTQDHDEITNIGWHPVKPGMVYACGNVREEILRGIYKDNNKMKAFIAGGYRSTDSTGVRLFECYQDAKGKIVSTHMSRGRLIKIGDRDFNTAFDAAYAKNVLRLGSQAMNNLKQIKDAVHQARSAAKK